jgi:hypothetical protein
MIDLRLYLESKKQQIADFIEAQNIPDNVTGNETFNNIATELQTRFPQNHRGQIGGRDKAHNVLAMTIMCSLWCGWLSQAKTNRNAYTQEWLDSFKKVITDAFEIGQEYSFQRP